MPRIPTAVVFAASLICLLGTALAVELTGGLPNQLAHLYYLPVVASALLLPPRASLVVAVVAALLVSPAVDLVHGALDQPVFYSDPAPWNLASNGWIVRPLAYLSISILAGRFAATRIERAAAIATSQERGSELVLLSKVDKMILSDVPEQEALQEMARLLGEFTRARVAGVVLPEQNGARKEIFFGYVLGDAGPYFVREELPLGEGVSGWSILHGRPATATNVLADPRYDEMADFARRHGYRSAAAVPIQLEGQVLGALVIGREREGDFVKGEIDALLRLAAQAAIAVSHTRQRDALREIALETATVLTDVIESRDAYTGEHCGRLVLYSGAMAEALSLTSQEIEAIRLGAALHDVGKIVVPDSILRKPDKLTPDEFATIKLHCYSGGQICKRVRFLERAYPVVYHHHERFDGKGYPDGLAKAAIPLGARIVAIADAFDAMNSDRPYRSALPRPETIRRLEEGAGSQWDPDLVELFLTRVANRDDWLKAA